jgi:hypothetical protein
MRAIQDFLTNSRAAMIDYIFVVSSPGPELRGPLSTHASTEMHDRLQAINALYQRCSTIPLLHRETIPLLPYLLDVPKHLAVISSAVIRRSRGYHRTLGSGLPEALDLVEFCEKCYVIEEHALQRVSRLAGRVMQAPFRKRPLTANVDGSTSLTSPKFHMPLRASPTPSAKEKGSPVTSLTSSTRRPLTAPPSPRDGPIEEHTAPPIPQAVPVTSSFQADATGVESSHQISKSPSFPLPDGSSLRRVQTCESMRPAPFDEANHKRKGFFRGLLSRK